MSEIDFAEIEKAMAELVNKAQGKERQQGLDRAAKERSQVAKEIETAQEQGDIATKRIVVATNAIRTNPHPPHPKPSAPIMPPNPGRVMDFVPPVSAPAQATVQDEQIRQEDSELQRTVGELSNEYLTEQVRDSELSSESGTESSLEPTEELEEDAKEQLDSAELESQDVQQDSPEEESAARFEELTGPAPVMSSSQEPTMPDVSLTHSEPEDSLPEADDLAEEVGKVHKIYGQKLPKEYLKKDKRDFSKKSSNQTESQAKVQNSKKRKGFAFYFVLVMIFASVVVWGAAAYLYFAY